MAGFSSAYGGSQRIIALPLLGVDCALATVVYAVAPVAGRLIGFYGIVSTANTGTDAVITPSVGATAQTSLAITIENDSTAGDVESATLDDSNEDNVVKVAANTKITCVSDAAGTSGVVNCYAILAIGQ